MNKFPAIGILALAFFHYLEITNAAEFHVASGGGGAGAAGVLSTLPDETMDDSLMRVRVDMGKRIQGHAIMREKTSDDWRFALDVGDGDFGAAIYGHPNQMKFDIGKNDITIYDRDVTPSYPLMSFPEIRERLAAGDTRPVWQSVTEAVSKSGDHVTRPSESWGGRLTLDFLGGKQHTDYREQLDFWSATATSFFKVDGREETVSTFASQPADVMVIRCPSLQEAVNVVLSRNPLTDPTDVAKAVYRPKFTLEDGMACLHMTMPSGDPKSPDEFVIVLGCDGGKIGPASAPSSIPAPTTAPSRKRGGMAHEFSAWQVARSGKPLTFFLTVVSSGDVRGFRSDASVRDRDLMDVAKARIQGAMARGYDAVRQEHLQWWQNYWKRSWVLMTEKAGEYPWYFSLYKAGSARRPGKTPPAYAAPWRGWDNIGWGRLCFNYEQIHYNTGNMVCNHGELMEPILGTLWHTRELIAARTKSFYGIAGLCYPHTISNRGNINHYVNTCMNIATSGEAVHLAWEYYEFTQDQDFLRNVGYPLLRDAATFYLHYLQEDENKQLYIFPSYYSETGAFLLNSINDQVMFRATLDHAAQAAELLGVDAAMAQAWRDALKRMQPIASKTDIWLPSAPNNPAKEVASRIGPYIQLYPIFPGGLVNRWHGSEELRKQADTTYRHWLGKHPEEWSKSFGYLAGARMGDRDYYSAMVRGACANLTEYGNITDSREVAFFRQKGFAVDSGTAFPAGVLSEFLLNSQFGEIRLFPAMPLTGHYAFHSLRARGGFLVSSEFRDGKVPYVLVKSLGGASCKVIQPFDSGAYVVVRDLGTGKILTNAADAKADQAIDFKTIKGHVYVIERKDIPLEKVPLIQR